MFFGAVTSVVGSEDPNEVLLEFEEESSAANMVGFFATCTVKFCGRILHVESFNNTELKKDNRIHPYSNASAFRDLKTVKAVSQTNPGLPTVNLGMVSATGAENGGLSAPGLEGNVQEVGLAIDNRCDNRYFRLSAHNCQIPTPTTQNLEVEQQIRIFGAD